jgi:preprotein translocase subunit SecA
MPDLLKKIIGDPNAREVKRAKALVGKINQHTEPLRTLSDSELRELTTAFKARHEKGESLDALLPEAFAAVREAAGRAIGMRHYDVQLMGGIILHQGKIAEMRTGEGKTLMETAPVYLNALSGLGVHVVTVNDYLVRRDAGWMAQIYHALGLSTGVIVHEAAFIFDPAYTDPEATDDRLVHLRPVARAEAYGADITYGTNNEFGFDYLRDNMVEDMSVMVQRQLNFAIVDEVDSILIDEARTPLIISAPAQEATDQYYRFAQIAAGLKAERDYTLDEKMKAAVLTDDGIASVEKTLGIDNIYEAGRIDEVRHIEQALKAEALFIRDRDYVIRDGEIIIVDEFTGRLRPGNRWSEGLHQAVEAKEKVPIKQESLTLATVTYQNYLRLYKKLSGMTGTAITEAEEFGKIYHLEVVMIPTNRDNQRVDAVDRIYKTEEGKFRAVAREVAERHAKGQPVLIGTVSIAKNELLSTFLAQLNVPHTLLNAKNNDAEATIVAAAGQRGAVTLATNIAGRGTDIVLEEGVADLGGLHVIGTERHEARRIDNQLRGRSGRQGDPGSSQFYVSLEDDLMRIFGSERIAGIMTSLGLDEDTPIENRVVSRSLESAQKKVEGRNFDDRKHLVEYDDVMNRHREFIYGRRRKVLQSDDLKPEIMAAIRREAEAMREANIDSRTNEINFEELSASLTSIIPPESVPELELDKKHDSEIVPTVMAEAERQYSGREAQYGPDLMRFVNRTVYLKALDGLWIEHLDAMDSVRGGIGLRQIGQRDPLVEYKREGFKMFQQFLGLLEAEVATSIFRVVVSRDEPTEAPVETELTKAAKRARPLDGVSAEANSPDPHAGHNHGPIAPAHVSRNTNAPLLSRADRRAAERQSLKSQAKKAK